MSGLYIHIPYCTRKCLYCDFYSGGARIADWQGLERALITEFHTRIVELDKDPTINTVYFGGGTPSLMPDHHLGNLVKEISHYAPTASEITLEVNPDDVTAERSANWRRMGINRISMGVQSFNEDELSSVGRRHTPEQAIDAYNTLRQQFDNISLDLIYDMPGQTGISWQHNIETTLSLYPEHISAYNMMYEPGTALTLLRDKGVIKSADDEQIIRWHKMLTDKLREAGYEHYETSNFAKPGFRSRHNSQYWDHIPYLGLGPSAHSYDGNNIRRANPADIKSYIRYFTDSKSNNKSHFYIEEVITADEKYEEIIMLRLRTSEGINLAGIEGEFGTDRVKSLLAKAKPLIEHGLMLLTKDNRLSITPSGVLTGDSIILRLI